MITGAQTKTPSVALSGPNAVISRLTLDPVVTVDDLKKYTFNIVPDRDPVARFDDLSQNYQRINCEAAANSPGGCHSAALALCEIMYTCGREERPIPCSCVYEHHYPYPKLISGDPSMNEMCYDEICKQTEET
uniref:Uncharacterized protein n=1 Tax=Chaetoceros debilis TaxID=122233 RepID=A0A7S3PUN5_9STRA|mmetsp:Transcript_2454/g.3663  ORF Transcript_2454/g.3663 Transcript_2454/m.3663 type:complete len:133 (+) Transcript_2454:247-645(+)